MDSREARGTSSPSQGATVTSAPLASHDFCTPEWSLIDLGVPFKFRASEAVTLPPLLEVKSETILLLLTWRTTIGVLEDEVGVGVASAALVGGVMGLGLDAGAAPPPAWGDTRTRETEPGPHGITDPAVRAETGETT